MKKTTVLLIDDHTLVRETWSFILNTQPNLEVLGEAGSAEEGINLTESLRPDIVIMDINLPGLNGIEATEIIKQKSPETKVLGVSLHTQPTYAKSMIKRGAWGYVTKNSSREEMFAAIAEVIGGKRYICQEIKNILAEQMASGTNLSRPSDLSKRETQIVVLVKEGKSSKEMAAVLGLSVKTIEVHRYNILKKLGLKNSAALVNFANKMQEEFRCRPN